GWADTTQTRRGSFGRAIFARTEAILPGNQSTPVDFTGAKQVDAICIFRHFTERPEQTLRANCNRVDDRAG
ncbi:MAG: hypothetical protein O2898_07970, partial [Proteobacteria bacterium]|nr:hypothetical protein [Pseudomonadota bacterium]